MNYETLTFERDGAVAIITLNRPDAANSLNVPMSEELVKVATHCDSNPDIRAVVFTGKGKMFSAGGDLGMVERMTEDFADRGPHRAIAVARIDGTLVGALVALTVQSERIDYLVIEDLVVDPAYRAHGIGAKLVSWAEEHARAAGISWLFLESGLHNEGAHAFFEKHGFHPMSKVFSKRI